MPLTRYQIRNEYSLADRELYRAADRDDPEALLEGVAMAGLVGVLRQLGDLAEFAAEVFHDLHEEVLATTTRGHILMVRVQQLEAEVPSIEKAFLSQTNLTPFYSNAGVDWHPNLRTEQNLIIRGDLPRCVMDSYEECRGPPRLFLLDKFDVAGAGACLKRYTDPSFFKVETAPYGPSVEVHRERKFRKVKKKGSCWKNGETPEIVPTSHAKLHQLFLEENVEKGRSDPARLVKLKKRQLNALPYDSRSGKSFMEKFLETQPEHNEVRENSVSPFPLKPTSDNSRELGFEIYDITTVSPVKDTSQGNERPCSSPNAHEVVLKPSMDDLYGEVIDRQIMKVPEPGTNGERDEILSIHHKEMDEKEIAVDVEGKPESCVDGGISDDMTSEVDNYMDALTTMESEMETGQEYRLKSDLGFSNIEKRGMDRNRKWGHLEFEAQSSDSQSIENFSASDDGNSSFKKGSSSFSYSDTLSNLAEITPSDGEGSAKEFPTSEAFIPENPEMSSNQLPADLAVLRTKCHDLMLPNDMCIDEDNIRSLGEGCSNSSLADSNHPLPPLDPATSSLQHQSDETPSESVELGFALSCRDGKETNWADSSAVFSDMAPQTSDGTPFAVSSESQSVDELDGGDPHVSSDVSLYLSNNSELAPEKKSSDGSPDEALQIDFAEKSFPDNTVDIKIGSSQSNTSPKEEQVPSSVLLEVEGSDVEKHNDLVSAVVDALPETEVYWENSTSFGDASQNCSFKEQNLSDIVDNIPQVELESAEETALCSEEANIADTSGTADSEKRGASTCKVDAVDREAVPLELPSNYMDCSVLEDHAGLDDVVAESVQAENMAVYSTATDNVPAEASADDDVDVVCSLLELICSPSNDTEDPLKDGLECNDLDSLSLFPPEAAQVNLEEMPPLPPLPPMQWRLGKIQPAPLVPQREFMDHSPQSYSSILPFRDHEKAQQSDIVQPANPVLPVSAVEVEKSHHVSEQMDKVTQPMLSSLQLPFMADDANGQTNSHGLEGTQSLNQFLTLSALPDEKPERGFLASEREVVQSSSNPFSSLPAVEDAASQYDHVSSSEKIIHSLNQSASEPGLQHTSKNLEGENGNPSDMSELPPSKVEDTASTYDPVSSLEKPILPLNQSASEPGLQKASENSEEEHRHPSADMSVLPPRKVEEQPQHGLPSSEGESAWLSNPFALLPTSEVGQVNGSSMVKLPRPRNPLIDAVAAHGKSKLRKVTERVRPQSEPKVDERNSLLEQIRTKSFNLKPALVSRPSIQGPKTNLRLAAILEKANAIRQATAGSDEDDDEDWSDS